ncbi:MAG: hypothetical protein HYY40_11290 [Bacteroidetes bacterium]|nr:hypothetical protein [Bacteroidota bacterium]
MGNLDDNLQSGNWTSDLDDQSSGNYAYDAIGNLTKDAKEKIKQIEWTVYGKVKRIIHLNKNDPTLNFTYDAQGNRAIKAIIFPSLILVPVMGGPTIYKPNPNNITTFYVRDASGNIMAIYEKKFTPNNFEYRMVEAPLYGSDRLGEYKPALLVKTKDPVTGVETLTPPPVNAAIFTRNLKKEYEMKDHLGSVRAVLSDRKFATITGGVATDFTGEVVSVSNMYAGGMLQPGRSFNSTDYSFGFNGKLKIDEVYGNGNLYDFDARLYDPRIMRPPSTDPLFRNFPELSPYQFHSNNPIWFIEMDGLQGEKPEIKKEEPAIKKPNSDNIQFYVEIKGSLGLQLGAELKLGVPIGGVIQGGVAEGSRRFYLEYTKEKGWAISTAGELKNIPYSAGYDVWLFYGAKKAEEYGAFEHPVFTKKIEEIRRGIVKEITKKSEEGQTYEELLNLSAGLGVHPFVFGLEISVGAEGTYLPETPIKKEEEKPKPKK